MSKIISQIRLNILNMKDHLRCFKLPGQLLLLGCLLLISNSFTEANNNSKNYRNNKATKKIVDPPVFTDPIPGDITVDCLDEVPDPVGLMATDDNDLDFPMTITSVDTPDPASIDPCVGGVITRTWTAIDDVDGLMTVEMQIITVSPDTEPPVVPIAEIHDTIACNLADYDLWISSTRLALNSNVLSEGDCSGIADIDEDPDAPFDDPCGTRVVTFTIMDGCGLSTVWTASYTTLDTIRPILVGVPDDVTIDCDDPIPVAPMVTATDNCSTPPSPTLSEISTQIADGSCTEYEYTITRTWTVTDECGNLTSESQVITVEDRNEPTFTVPADVTISCDEDFNDLSITGNVTDEADNCDPSPRVFFTDVMEDGSCPQEFTIIRTWRARDTCGNVAGKVQTITIADTDPPSFDVPDDITVSCEQADDLGLTGEPTNEADNCDGEVDIDFSDVIIAGVCENSYMIRRTWKGTDDCGNFIELDQIITVVDNTNPIFDVEASDLTITCASDLDIAEAFNNWVASFGGGQVSDNCTINPDFDSIMVNSGTANAPSLPAVMCPTSDSILISQAVDFIIEDECGNRDTSTATFVVIDDLAPSLRNCPSDTIIATDPGICQGSFTLLPPIIEEECAVGFMMEDLSGAAFLTSSALPGQEGDTPVDPFEINLTVTGTQPINAFGDGTLSIELSLVDAEEETEFFNVLGEDGTLLGKTENTPTQCGNSITTLTLTEMQLNSWAQDGTITIRFEPNIPDGELGRTAINPICNPISTVEVDLSFTTKVLTGITYEYRLNQGERIEVQPFGPVNALLELGDNIITYYATDCAGNVDSCAYTVRVQDEEPPVLDCPDDITVSLEDGECTAMVTLPLPDGATDNCSVGSQYLQTLPADTMSAYFTFRNDPNLNDFLAEAKIIAFSGVAANATGNATLKLDLKGDFSTNGAFLEIIGEDGSSLGTTNIGVADCMNPGQESFIIPRNTFNLWAADGMLEIQIIPNDITVPPGVPGDGINPCNPSAVNISGDIDSVSYVFATLSYDELTPAYFAEGETTIPFIQMMAPGISPTHEFNLGETEIFYIIQDESGNPDTCSYLLTVEDNEPPVALCQPTTLFINPSGLDIQTIDAALIDGGSTDNCSIDTMFVTPNTFDCAATGATNVTLTVIDGSNNESTCTSLVRIETQLPMPTASSGLCGGDTLFLVANPPPAEGGIIFTYRWFFDGNLISVDENPIIPNIDGSDAGSYLVEITGLTNCTAIASVQVAIEDLPLTPLINTNSNFCTDEDVVLNSSVIPNGSSVSYNWFRGLPPNGTLIATTTVPSFTIPAPNIPSSESYYLTIESDGCLSQPSAPVNVSVTDIPVAVVNDDEITICEGESFTLGTFVVGDNITYEWTGPNNYNSSNQFPEVIENATLANAGVYRLVVANSGCESEPDFVVVNILPRPSKPNIANTGPACEGEDVQLTTDVVGASVYTWIAPDLSEFLTTTNTLDLNSVSEDQEGDWRVFATQFGCASEVSEPTSLVVNTIPDAGATAEDLNICEGDQLRLMSSPTIVGATYEWKGPNGFASPVQNPIINNASEANEGTYTVTITTPEGCADAGTINITVLESVSIISVTNDAPACLTGPTDIKLFSSVFPVDDGSYRYEWRNPNGVIISVDSVATIPNATEMNNGTYTLSVTTSAGCTSAVGTTVVDVSDRPITPEIPSLINGEGPFCIGDSIILGVNAYSGTTVQYLWRTPNGSVTTSVPTLSIFNAEVDDDGAYSVQVNVDGCGSNESGQRMLSIGTIPVVTAGSNSPVCSGDNIELTTTIIPEATYEWFGPVTSSMPQPIIAPANPGLHTGTYTVVATLNGCESEPASVDVLVKQSPTAPTALNGGSVCISEIDAVLNLSIDSMTAVDGATYSWCDEFGSISEPSSELTFSLSNFENYPNDGTYAFYAKAQLDGCVSELSNPTVVDFNVIPNSQAFAGDDTTSCSGIALDLNAEAPSVGTGIWSLVAGNPIGVTITNPSEASTSVNGLAEGTIYTFQWTLSNGACVNYSEDQIQVIITEAEEPEAGDNILACSLEEVMLNAIAPSDPNSTGVWSQPEVQEALGVIIENPSDPNTFIMGLEPDNLYSFTWTITSGCGQLADEMFVTISDPAPFAGEDTIACNNLGEAVLNGMTPTLGSSGSWSTTNSNVMFNNPVLANAMVSGLTPGENLFIWTIDEGACGDGSRDSVTVFYKMIPEAKNDQVPVPFGVTTEFNVFANDFTPPATIATVINAPQNGKIENLGDGLFSYVPDVNFVGEDELTYEICSDGCECSTATVTLSVGDDAKCDAPNIMTPNNDGINDVLAIPCLLNNTNFPNSQVLVFNRWGDEVFRSTTPYQNDWNGTFDGEDLPAGTYFYIIDFGNGEEPLKGFVMIQR